MSDLWIYRRRPSSLTRYRHGGAAAFDPALRSPLAKAAVHAGGEPGDDQKILQFPAPAATSRPQRAGKPRRARPKLRIAKKPKKPKKPKKRD